MDSKSITADDVLGKLAGKLKVIDHRAVTDFWEIPVLADIQIRYSEDSLNEAFLGNQKGEQWMLVYHSGLSVGEMREKLNVKKINTSALGSEKDRDLFHDPGLLKKMIKKIVPGKGGEASSHESFLNISTDYKSVLSNIQRPAYYLLNFKGKFFGRKWQEQEIMFSALSEVGLKYVRTHENVVTDAVICNFAIYNHERLMEKWDHCGMTTDFPGHFTYAGWSGLHTLSMSRCMDYIYSSKGVVFSRKFDF